MNLPLLPPHYKFEITTSKPIDEIVARFEKESNKSHNFLFYRRHDKFNVEKSIENKGSIIANLKWECIPIKIETKLVFNSPVYFDFGEMLGALFIIPAIILFSFSIVLLIKSEFLGCITLIFMYLFWYLALVGIMNLSINTFLNDMKRILK